jgi:hypothetical protein
MLRADRVQLLRRSCNGAYSKEVPSVKLWPLLQYTTNQQNLKFCLVTIKLTLRLQDGPLTVPVNVANGACRSCSATTAAAKLVRGHTMGGVSAGTGGITGAPRLQSSRANSRPCAPRSIKPDTLHHAVYRCFHPRCPHVHPC